MFSLNKPIIALVIALFLIMIYCFINEEILEIVYDYLIICIDFIANEVPHSTIEV